MKTFLLTPFSFSLFIGCCLAYFSPSVSAVAEFNDSSATYAQEKESDISEIIPDSKVSYLLDSDEPLPVNDRILSLMQLLQHHPKKNISKVKEILPQLKSIDKSFNAAEQYLMLFIEGLVEHTTNNFEDAIILLEKTLILRDDIPKKQLYLPEFAIVNLTLAKSFAAQGDFKQAFEYKKKYIINGYQYFDATRKDKIEELNKTYSTDHKVKKNELLANENKIKRLKIIDAENKKFAQQRNITILIGTVFFFSILLLRQIKARKILKHLAKTDSLTKLYNRRTLFEQGAIAVDTAVSEQQSLSVILLDIDYLKNINDNYGHEIGDEVIKIIANLGSETMRSRDIFARLGGEEFAGILPGVGCAEAKAIAERLREKVASVDLSILNIEQQLTVSIGVACLEQVNPNFDDLLNAADLAMYFSKSTGRNRVCLYSPQTENKND